MIPLAGCFIGFVVLIAMVLRVKIRNAKAMPTDQEVNAKMNKLNRMHIERNNP